MTGAWRLGGAGETTVPTLCRYCTQTQGSEYPAVVIPLLTQHFLLLQRNVLYTAITRAAKIVTAHARLVGDEKAIAIATKNNRVTQRMTRLAERLRMAEH